MITSHNTHLLEETDLYLNRQAYEIAHRYSWLFHPETIDMDVNDLAQTTRIRFWEVSSKQPIRTPKAYLSRMVHNKVIDMVRHAEPTFPLPLDQHGELYQGHMLLISSQGWRDPSQEAEQEANEQEVISEIVKFITTLPARQRQAMLVLLRPLVTEIYALEQAFYRNQIDLSTAKPPESARERQHFKSYLAKAKQKLAMYLVQRAEEDTYSQFKRWYSHDEQAEIQRKKEQLQRKQRKERSQKKSRALAQQMQTRNEHIVSALQQHGHRLPGLYATVLQYHYQHHQSLAVIAKTLQTPEGTIKARCHRGVQLLWHLTEYPQQEIESLPPEAFSAEQLIHLPEIPEPYQTILRLRCVNRQSYCVIAATFHLAENTIKSYVSRGKKMLLTFDNINEERSQE